MDVSAWTGDPFNASFIYSQLHLLHETIGEARHLLKGEGNVRGDWWDTSATSNVRPFLRCTILIALLLTA